MTENIDTLSKFGQSFQTKVIGALLTDEKFLSSIEEITTTKFFESEANKWIVQEIIDYFQDYKRPPTMDVFKVKVSNLDDEVLKTTVVNQLRNVYTQVGNVDLDYIKDEYKNFCKNQNLKQVILSSVDLLKSGQYDRIKDMVDGAMKVGVSEDLGTEYVQDFDLRTEDINRSTVPTAWQPLNELLDGGLGPGELGVAVAPSGVGKCVGKNTEIEIQYEEIGIEISGGHIMWFSPWDKIYMNDSQFYYAWEVEKIITISGYGKT